MKIRAIDEYNDAGHLIYSENCVGAFVRGRTREEAVAKFGAEIAQYARWAGMPATAAEDCTVEIVQQKLSALNVCDADSDVLFHSERPPLSAGEYGELKALALRSASDFLELYSSIPDKDGTTLAPRKTFYGDVPVTARDMYEHTKNVNGYYFGEIGVSAQNGPDIYQCRKSAFDTLAKRPDYLDNAVYDGSYGEQWSLRKVCRRFVWHDRIHARAVYRMAIKLCGADNVKNPFMFDM